MPSKTLKRCWLRRSQTLNTPPERVAAKRFQGDGFYEPKGLLQVRYEAAREALYGRSSRSGTALAHCFSRYKLHRLPGRIHVRGRAGLVQGERGPPGPTKVTPEILR